jgi:hypothetical protein
MRFLALTLVLLSRIASADPSDYLKPWEREGQVGVSFELGGGWQRVRTNGVTYRAEYLRFAPQVSLTRLLYLGAALQLGHIYSASGIADGMYVPPGSSFVDESGGSIVEPQIFIAARGLISIVSGAVEVAPTVRWTSASTNYEYLTTTTSVTTLELHARADIWATARLSAGIAVGMDVASMHDFEAGLQFAFHFEPYDAMSR